MSKAWGFTLAVGSALVELFRCMASRIEDDDVVTVGSSFPIAAVPGDGDEVALFLKPALKRPTHDTILFYQENSGQARSVRLWSRCNAHV